MLRRLELVESECVVVCVCVLARRVIGSLGLLGARPHVFGVSSSGLLSGAAIRAAAPLRGPLREGAHG